VPASCFASPTAQLTDYIFSGNRLDLYQQPAREVKESFFEDYALKGFKNIRIPVCWDGHTNESAPYLIDPAFLDIVANTVDWSLSRGMVAVLNTHHEKWLDEAGSAFNQKLPRLEAMWTQIAAKFAGYNETLLFEVFNEPKSMSVENLNDMNSAIVPIIRKQHPTRIILLMGLKFGNPSWILANPTSLKIPAGGQLMLEIHNYDPFKYAGSNPTQKSWGSAQDEAALQKWVSGISAWSKTNKLPLFYGEFGCTNTQTAATGRDKWFRAHAAAIKTNGWGASVWNDGGGHLIYSYTNGTWVDAIVADLGYGPPTPAPAPTPPPPPTPPPVCAAAYKRCGSGGATCCLPGCTCDEKGPTYSRCDPPSGKHSCS
jgi:aryl-phospho-beta-D-glucosidase BglC (GH1 family)